VRLLCPHCHPPDGLWLIIKYFTLIQKLSSSIIDPVRHSLRLIFLLFYRSAVYVCA
jgi:hypothetical protein